MLQEFKKHIDTHFSVLKGKKILVAISGGIDSVVLTHLMYQLNFDVSLAHCNFQLRDKESDLDEAFICDLSKSLSIQAHVIRFNTNEYAKKQKLSIQIAARALRYNYFKELTANNGFDYLLTAHHADDNLETFLINLTRGTGLEGLTGIPAQNGNIIRPLLPFSRATLETFANKHALLWREDKSNSEQKYVRNRIRHQIVPILKEINPSLLQSFSKTTTYLEESKTIVDDSIKVLSKEIITKDKDVLKINIDKVLKLSNPKAYLYQFLKEYQFFQWDKVNDLLTAQTGKYLQTNTYMLLKNRGFLVLSPLKNKDLSFDEKYYIYEKTSDKIDFPIKISVVNNKKIKVVEKKTILVDKKLVFYPLLIRKRKKGDFFYPSGMLGKKKVSKFFKDEKLSLIEKENTWLLCDKDDNIIWIIGLRLDKRFQININTTSILKISI